MDTFSFLTERPLRGEIVGVKIVGDDLGVNFQDALHVLDGFLKKIVAFEIFKIADVLAEERFGATNNADRVFQFATNGENRFGFMFEGNGHRNKATRAAKHLSTCAEWANHGIVTAAENVAIVDEISIGDALEAPDRFVVVDGDRFFAEVRAGHDKSIEFTTGEEKMMKRGVGEKDTEIAIAWCDALGESGAEFAREEHDGTFDGEQEFAREVIGFAEMVDVLDVTEHDGERLFDAAFAFA